MKIDENQAAILTFLFEKLPIGKSVSTLDFPLSGAYSDRHYVAYANLTSSSDSGTVVFTLPKDTKAVFLALTKENQRHTARLLANLEDYERENEMELKLGEVIIVPDSEAHTSQLPFAVILLPTATSLDCAKVPNVHEINGQLVNFLLAVPLTKDEWTIRNRNGHDALIQHFIDTDKALFFDDYGPVQ